MNISCRRHQYISKHQDICFPVLGTKKSLRRGRSIVASRAVAASKSCSRRMALSFGRNLRSGGCEKRLTAIILNTWCDGSNLPQHTQKKKATPCFLNSNPHPNQKSPGKLCNCFLLSPILDRLMFIASQNRCRFLRCLQLTGQLRGCRLCRGFRVATLSRSEMLHH